MLAIVIVVVLSAGISFMCSLMEAALYAVPMSKIEGMVANGVRGSRRLRALREKVDLPISAILTFNTIGNTVGGMILGVMVGRQFGDDPFYTLFVFPTGFTLIILVFSEIIPKTLGVVFAETIAPKSALLIQILIAVLYPFVLMSQYITAKIRTAGAEQATVKEEDIITLSQIGADEGSLLPKEAQWVQNALKLNDKTAHDIMTPRTVVYTLPAELRLTDVKAHSKHWTHSRLPICEDNNPDKIVGLVYRRDVFDTLLQKQREELGDMTLRDLMLPVEMIPESLNAHSILQRFLEKRQHLFVVTDEHGGLEGVLTLEDVIEEMLGEEIVDHHDLHEDMQAYARLLAQQRKSGISPTQDSNSTATP